MASPIDHASYLRAQAELWQGLVARQLDLTIQMRQLVREQRELAAQWAASGSGNLADQAAAIENNLRDTARQLVQFELLATQRIAEAIAAGTDELRLAKGAQFDTQG